MAKILEIQKYRALRQLKVLQEDVTSGKELSSNRYLDALTALQELRRKAKKKSPTPHVDLPFGERRQRDRAKSLGFSIDYFTMKRYRAERDKEIISQLDEGRSFTSVAEEHWLSTRRVSGIWYQVKCVENFNKKFKGKVRNYRGIYVFLREKGYDLDDAFDVVKECTPRKGLGK